MLQAIGVNMRSGSLSMNTIIMMALGLLLFITLLFLLGRGAGFFVSDTMSCESQGGVSVRDHASCPARIGYQECPGNLPVCCLPEVGS